MRCRQVLIGAWGILWSTALIAVGQETKDQADALAVLAAIEGKATLDPAHPKRVIGIDI